MDGSPPASTGALGRLVAWARTIVGGGDLVASGTRARPARASLVGTGAPAIRGPDPLGAPVTLQWDTVHQGDGQQQLIAFLTGGCTTCQTFWTGSAEPPPGAPAAGLPVVIVTPSPSTESRRGIAARATGGQRVIMSTDAWLAYGVRGAPWFVLVTGGVVRAEGHAGSWAELGQLVDPRRGTE